MFQNNSLSGDHNTRNTGEVDIQIVYNYIACVFWDRRDDSFRIIRIYKVCTRFMDEVWNRYAHPQDIHKVYAQVQQKDSFKLSCN